MSDDDRGYVYALALAAFIAIVAGGVFWYLKTNTYTENGIVAGLTWTRDINVNVMKQLDDNSERGAAPADAYDLAPYTETWTTYDEICIGSGKNETCTQYPQFHTDYRVRYHVNRWVYDHTLRNSGTPRDERLWPDFTPSVSSELGAQQERDRVETFYVAFKTTEGKSFTFTTNDANVWRRYGIETHWKFQVNRFEEPQWTTLARA